MLGDTAKHAVKYSCLCIGLLAIISCAPPPDKPKLYFEFGKSNDGIGISAAPLLAHTSLNPNMEVRLVFFGDCTTCSMIHVDEFKALDRLGHPMVLVFPDADSLKLAKPKTKLPCVLAQGRKFAKLLKADYTPRSYILDRKLVVVAAETGNSHYDQNYF